MSPMSGVDEGDHQAALSQRGSPFGGPSNKESADSQSGMVRTREIDGRSVVDTGQGNRACRRRSMLLPDPLSLGRSAAVCLDGDADPPPIGREPRRAADLGRK